MTPNKKIFMDFINNLKFVAFLLNTQKSKIVLMIIFSLACMVIGIIIPYVWGQITNELFYGLQNSIIEQNDINLENSLWLIGILLSLYLISFILNLAERLISTKVSNNITYDLRRKIIHKINCLPIAYHEESSTGDLLSRIINDVENVGNITTSMFVEITTTTTLLIASLVMMFVIQPILASLATILIPISYIFIKIIIVYSQGHYIRQTEYLGKINSLIEESINGLAVVNIYNKQNNFRKEFAKINDKYYEESMKSRLINLLTNPVLLILINLSYIISVVVGAFLCVLGTLTVGDIISFTQYLKKVVTPFQSFMNFSDLMQSMAASARRIFNYLEENSEASTVNSKTSVKSIRKLPAPIIKIDNVSFSYDGKNNVIENFDLEAYKGQTIAIVGPTGSGKTTIIKLLLKFYENYSGEIFIENTNIKDLSKKDTRNHFAIVLQKVWVFYDSIANNIRYGNLKAKDTDIIKVSKLTNVHNFVNKMHDKYNTKISENGNNLSNGQKQLIAITRALIANKEIIILDEATSSVDSKTEKEIYKAFDKIIKNKTAIVIAHRLSTVKNADNIIVINRGKIVEEGTHENLLENRGFYYDLYTSSTREDNN